MALLLLLLPLLPLLPLLLLPLLPLLLLDDTFHRIPFLPNPHQLPPPSSPTSPDMLTFDDLGSILSSQTNDPVPSAASPSPSKASISSAPLVHAAVDIMAEHLDLGPAIHRTAAATDYGMITSISSSSSSSSSHGAMSSALGSFLLGTGGDDPTARVLIFLLSDSPGLPPALAQAAWMMRGVVR